MQYCIIIIYKLYKNTYLQLYNANYKQKKYYRSWIR